MHAPFIDPLFYIDLGYILINFTDNEKPMLSMPS